eukprot:4534869-Amphidinium_carterae.1
MDAHGADLHESLEFCFLQFWIQHKNWRSSRIESTMFGSGLVPAERLPFAECGSDSGFPAARGLLAGKNFRSTSSSPARDRDMKSGKAAVPLPPDMTMTADHIKQVLRDEHDAGTTTRHRQFNS